MNHLQCFVTSHTRMTCPMPVGAGKAFKVVLTIGSQSSIETQMSYGPPSINTISDDTGTIIDSISTRGSEIIVLNGNNFPNDKKELDTVKFGSTQLGYQTFSIVEKSMPLAVPGTCRIDLILLLMSFILSHSFQTSPNQCNTNIFLFFFCYNFTAFAPASLF